MIAYLLESAFCLACLYLFYLAVLRRETFFHANRAYLVLAPLFSLLAPALNLQLTAPAAKAADEARPAVPVLVEHLQVAPLVMRETLEQPVAGLTLGDLLWYVYLAVATVFAVRLIVQVVRLGRLIRRLRTGRHPAVPVASFFGYVFWPPDGHTDGDRQLIWAHERVHVRQWHSFDVLLIEMLIVVQWFNPLLYLYRRSLREVHEFLADAAVVRQSGSRRAYAALLVEQSRKPRTPSVALVTTFHSLLKPRLKMLAKQPSRPWRRMKFLLALPLAAALMLLFSFRFIEKIPAASPLLHQAVQRAGVYTTTLNELTVRAPKISAPEDPRPILYWGTSQCRLDEHASGGYYAAMQLTATEFYDCIDEPVFLWDGKALHRDLPFSLGDFRVGRRHDGQGLEHFLNHQLRAKRFAADVAAGQTWQATGLHMPDGRTIHFTLHITADEAASGGSEVNLPSDNDLWQALPAGKKYLTVPQFWHYIGTLPFFNGNWDNAARRYTIRGLSADGQQMVKVSFATAPQNAAERQVQLDHLQGGELAGLLGSDAMVQLEDSDPARTAVGTEQIIIVGDPAAAPRTAAAAPAVSQSVGLDVFPNPGTNQTLLLRAPAAGPVEVNFWQLDGRRAGQLSLELTAGENRVAIPVDLLPEKGPYVAEVLGFAGRSTIRFVVE